MLKQAGETYAGFLESHEVSLTPHLPEILPNLLKTGNLINFPTNAGWAETKVGSGATGQEPASLNVRTGMTANSSAVLYAYAIGLAAGRSNTRIDWTKKLYLLFTIFRASSDAQVIARVQLKGTTAMGQLAEKGIGLQLSNFALTGESYGTARGTQSLELTIENNKEYQVMLLLDPHTPKIEYYVDIGDGQGLVLRASETTAANIPAVAATTDSAMVVSINNGASPANNCSLYCGQVAVWQER